MTCDLRSCDLVFSVKTRSFQAEIETDVWTGHRTALTTTVPCVTTMMPTAALARTPGCVRPEMPAQAGAGKLRFTRGKKLQGFGSLADVEWKGAFAKSPERQPDFHRFTISEAQINLTPRLDFLSYDVGFNIDPFCILLHQLLLGTGWKSSRNIADNKWFDKTWDTLSAAMFLILKEIRTLQYALWKY